MATKKWTEAKLAELIAARYRGTEWGFLRSVPNATGAAKSRTCDALVMALWPSNGLHLHGFEIKTSRYDWLREIQDVSKAEAFAKFCHYWWIVAPKGIVSLEELPARWGLMEPGGKSLKVRKPAENRITVDSPTAEFLAALLRSALKNSPARGAISAARQRGREEAAAAYEKALDAHKAANNKALLREHEALKKAVEQFEQASGVKIESYVGGHIGDSVRLVRAAKLPSVTQAISRLQGQLAQVHSNLSEAVKSLEKAQEQQAPSLPFDEAA